MSEAADCKHAPGAFMPVIERNRCEGKWECVRVCPYKVFSKGTLPQGKRGELSFKGRMKGWAHGWQQAFASQAEACHGCGLCVSACPEHAITLVRS